MNKKYTSLLSALFFLLAAISAERSPAQEVTGLNDWTLFIDPGHAQTENMGIYGYSEAEKVLRVALALRDFFLQETDIQEVYMARLTDQDVISLTARISLANTLGADFYYSIHSDASDNPGTNSTLMLYGGWKSDGVLVEKTPPGGGAYGAILDLDLTGAMRIGRRGNFADRVFYQGNIPHHANQFSYLAVNRSTTMASLLSEAGFHTNPGQQMLNMNAQWKVLEALSAYRSFLEWHDIDRPAIGVATGIVRDADTGLPINGATVTIGDKTYTTDTYASLFNKYSTNPEQLRNGFYYIPELEPLSTVEVKFSKTDYHTLTSDLEIVSVPNGRTHENLSFLDVALASSVPPVVSEVIPAADLDDLLPGTDLVIRFSRQMDQASVEASFSITPQVSYSLSWANPFSLVINTAEFDYLQQYTLTLDGDIARNLITTQYLDGNNDGQEGGDFVLSITMSEEDITAPKLLEYSPSETAPARMLRPIIRLVYDEEIMQESISNDAIVVKPTFGGEPIQGEIHHIIVNEQSILHFFPIENLQSGAAYTVNIAAGLADMFDNATADQSFQFNVYDYPITQTTVIDNFNSGIVQWWGPLQANQTSGVIPELTIRTPNTNVTVRSAGSTGSMRLSYGWDMDFAGSRYIRQYLPQTAPQNNNRFNIGDILQVYIFGDGSGNQVRLMIRDGLNHLEAQQWITIDWMGWKLVSWDLANDPAFGWVNGNGVLEGANFYIDGFHMRYVEGARAVGAVYFDHLHFVKRNVIQYPTTLFENWQDYDDFSTSLFPWTTIDLKGDPTLSPNDFTFPGAGEPFAFKVLNPSQTAPPVVDIFPPADGDKYLIAMQSQSQDENKWLISPPLRGTVHSQLSFKARSADTESTGPEHFRVWIMEDNNSVFHFKPESFVSLTEGQYEEAPADWTRFEYFLGNYADKVYRFAIQYVSQNNYLFMLDELKVDKATTYALSLTSEPELGGQPSGAGEYAAGQQVQLGATPETGYEFIKWTDSEASELSTDAAYTFIMPAHNLSLTAHFAMRNYTLTLLPIPENGGTVQGAGNYTFGQDVNAVATPAQGFRFAKWSNRDGDEISILSDYSFSMPASNVELHAIFETDDTATDQLHLSGMRIYPNPAHDKIYVFSDEFIKFVRIIDLTGRIIMEQQADATHMQLNLQNLQPGIYLIHIVQHNNITHSKIQINR